MAIKLDLKKFKHVKSDDKCTTLRHDDGHELIVAHKALSKDMKAQLEALTKAKPEDKDNKKKFKESNEDMYNIEADAKSRIEEMPHIKSKKAMAEGGEVIEEQPQEDPLLNPGKQPILPEDETTFNPEEIRNVVIDKLGLPNDWRLSEADRKRWESNAPMMMGMSAGTMGKVIPADKVAMAAQKMSPILKIGSEAKTGFGSFGKVLGPDGLPLAKGGVFKAEGGEVEDPNEQMMTQMPAASNIAQEQPQTADIDPAVARKREIYNTSIAGMEAQQDPGMMAASKARMFGPNGEEPNVFDAARWEMTERKFADEQANNAAQTAAAQQEAIAQNQARTSAGLKPIPVPNVPEGPQLPGANNLPQVAETEVAAQPQQPQAEVMPVPKGDNSQVAAINQMANVQAQLGNQQAEILRQQIDTQNQAKVEYKQQYDLLEAERQAHMADIKAAHIDPNQYWTGDKNGNGSHSKIMAGIGMILAGFNPTNKPNAAIDFINKQMEMNLEAQKQNLNSEHNLLQANLRQFGNYKDAADMTRIMQSDIVHNQLLEAAAKAQSPMAKAQVMMAAAQIKGNIDNLQQTLAANQTVNRLMTDPKNIPTALAILDQSDPKRANDLRSKWIPNVGIASTAEGAKGVREMGATVSTVRDSVAKLREIAKRSGKSLSLNDRAEADTIRNMLIGQLRVPITGPGAMSEGEREILMATIPDVVSITSLDSSNKKRLDTLENKVINQYKNMLQLNGMNPNVIQGERKSVQDQSAQALKWAKANPNNPKAQQILKYLGQK